LNQILGLVATAQFESTVGLESAAEPAPHPEEQIGKSTLTKLGRAMTSYSEPICCAASAVKSKKIKRLKFYLTVYAISGIFEEC
jgi:hypothetical protein